MRAAGSGPKGAQSHETSCRPAGTSTIRSPVGGSGRAGCSLPSTTVVQPGNQSWRISRRPPGTSTVARFDRRSQCVMLQPTGPSREATGAARRAGADDGAWPPITSRQNAGGTVRGTNQTSSSAGLLIQGWDERPAASCTARGSGNAVPGGASAGTSAGTASSGAVNRPYHGTAASAAAPASANAARRGARATRGGSASVRTVARRQGNWSLERTGRASQARPAGGRSARNATRAAAAQSPRRGSDGPRKRPTA